MANNINKRNTIMYNNVSDQRLTYANQLNVQSWNDIINILKTQANINANYLSTLHNWLVGENETTYILNSDKSFIEYVSEDLATYKWVDDNYYKKRLVYTKDEALALGLIEMKEYNEDTGEISLVYNADLYNVDFDETTGNLIFTFNDNDVIKEKIFKISDPDMFRLSFKTVESLPTENISTSTIYLILNENITEDNIYTEYIYSNDRWEIIGTTQINLDKYAEYDEDKCLTTASPMKDQHAANKYYVDTATKNMVEWHTSPNANGSLVMTYQGKALPTPYGVLDDISNNTVSGVPTDDAVKNYIGDATKDMVKWRFSPSTDGCLVTTSQGKAMPSPFSVLGDISNNTVSGVPTDDAVKNYINTNNKLKLIDSGYTDAQDGNIGWFEFAINKQLNTNNFYLIEINFYDYGSIKFILAGGLSHCLLVDYNTDDLIHGYCEYTNRTLSGATYYMLVFRTITTNYAMYCDGTYTIYEFPFSL